jgi:hypothetical protein
MTPLTTGGAVTNDCGAVAAVVQLHQQLGEPPLLSLLRCMLIHIWGCHHLSLPTTGGPIVAVIRLRQQLGEGLLLLLPSSVFADDWGTHLCHCSSLPMTGGAVVDVAAFI